MLASDGLAFSDGNGHLTTSIESSAHMLGDGSDKLLRGENDLVLGSPFLDFLLILLEGLHLVLVQGVHPERFGRSAIVEIAQNSDLKR